MERGGGGDWTCEDAKERRFLLIKLFPLECLTRRPIETEWQNGDSKGLGEGENNQ